MAYQKQTWKDEVLTGPERYRIDQGGVITHPGASIELITEVAQAASPVNAARMNHIEDGIGQHDIDLTNIANDYKAADIAITTAYKAADTAITTAYKAADTALDGRITTLNNDVYYNGAWQGMGVPASPLNAASGSQARYRRLGRMIEFQIANYTFEYSGTSTIYTSQLIFTIPQEAYRPLYDVYFPVNIWADMFTGSKEPTICQGFIYMGTPGNIYFCFKSSEAAVGTKYIAVTGTYAAAPTVK